ncbi:hypothetical protein MKY95_10225 [Paenibacillus sp. FSL P4-0176]|uniref:hypothetical protein n=1 Tax=Paenibacillus sp. FSL P4-0176 TaxID=2921631 RepID=UPI0030D58DDD
MSSFDYQKSTLTKYRNGTSIDPYIDITETKTVVNGQILLDEIPVYISKVKIANMFESPSKNRNVLKENEYRVDYSEGVISFHISAENTQKTYSYKGRGNHYVSSARIWTEEHDGNVLKTLKDSIDASNEAIKKVEQLDRVIEDSEEAIQNMEEATILAETQAKAAETNAQYAKKQGDYASEQADNAKDQSIYAKSQGAYAKEQGDHAKDQVLNAQEVIVEANNKIEDLHISIQNANDKIDEIEATRLVALDATENANTQADRAKTAAEHATSQGNYAKEQGDFAKGEVEATRNFLTEVNLKVEELEEVLGKASDTIGETEGAIKEAHESAEYAKSQGDYAKEQGEFSKGIAESLVHKGNYSDTASYKTRNIVYFNGATFMSIKDSIGETPTNTEFWKKITNTTWQGTYTPVNTYHFGDIVTDTVNENIYMCVADDTLNVDFTNENHWTLMISISTVLSSAKVATEEAIEAIVQTVNATATAIAAATNADEKAGQAEAQASYAEIQGDYAKAQGELAYDRGTSLANKGMYNSTITYKPLNIVVYESGVYQNIKESIDILPTDTTHWSLLLQTNTSVTWDSIAGKPNVETVEGSQEKATLAEENSKKYADTKQTVIKLANNFADPNGVIALYPEGYSVFYVGGGTGGQGSAWRVASGASEAFGYVETVRIGAGGYQTFTEMYSGTDSTNQTNNKQYKRNKRDSNNFWQPFKRVLDINDYNIIETNVKAYTDSKFSEIEDTVQLIDGDVKGLNVSLNELADSINDITSDINQHVNNEDIHITKEEKTAWNNKQDALSYLPESIEHKGKPSGYASLDEEGKVPLEQLPSITSSGSEPAKVFNNQYKMPSGGTLQLGQRYGFNNSIKAIVTGITIFIPDDDVINDGNEIKLDKLKDILDTNDEFTLTWFDNTPLGRKVARAIAILDESGTVQLTDLSYEMNNNYCSVYVDGVRFFEGSGNFTFQELTSTSIKVNGDFSGSEVQIEVLTN